MKNYKESIIATAFLLCCSMNVQAQDTISKKRKAPPSVFAHNSMQKVGPNPLVIKGGIKHPRVFEFYLNGNAAFPTGNAISNSARFNPSVGLHYIFENNLFIGLEGSYLTANSNIDYNRYAAPLANNPTITATNNNSNYKSTSVFLNGGYCFPLSMGSKQKNWMCSNFKIGLGAGFVFNTLPEQSVNGSFNGTSYSVFSNTPPDGYSKTNFALKPKMEFVYMINDWLGFNVNAQYQANLGAKDYSYSYKDLSNVDFTKPFDIVNQQIFSAPTVTQTTKGITGSFSIGGGFVFALGRNKRDYRHGKGVIDIKIDPMGRTTKPDGE